MHRLSILVIFVALIACQKKISIPYPSAPPPDSIASFLPGIVNTPGDSLEFNACFSPDGQSFYFTRNRKDQQDIYVSRYESGQWQKAARVSFVSSQYNQADPAFSPDGSLYFISNRPQNDLDTLLDFNIWFVKPLVGDSWSSPAYLSIVNTDSTEFYVSFSPQGDLYFASSRAGGFGKEDIYVSRNVGGKLQTPENLGAAINTEFSEHDPGLPPNGSFLLFTSVDRPGGLGMGDLYYSIKDANGNWTQARSLSSKFNTSTYDFCPCFTPDNQYFFYSSGRDVKWMRVETLPEGLRSLMR